MTVWVRYSLWTLGMFVMLAITYHFELLTFQGISRPLHAPPGFRKETVISFGLGIYCALLIIKGLGKVNIPLLVCIAVPSTLVFLYTLFAASFDLTTPGWISRIDARGLEAALSGFSLMAAFFYNKSEKTLA